MGLISKIAKIDRKFSWSFLGFILAIIFGGLAVYSEFFKSNSPIINYEVFYNEGIVDIKEDLGKLDIIYDGIDIRKKKQSLRAIIIRVSNTGNQSLLKSYYDDQDPLGIEFSDGKIIKSEIMHASDEYLKNNAHALVDGKLVKFTPVIMDKLQFFVYKFLILHDDNTTPSIKPLGKIAGVPAINLIDRIDAEEKKGFWSQVIEGTLLVNVVRLPVYFIGFFIAVGIIVFPIAGISSFVDEHNKKVTVKKYQAHINRALDKNEGKIFSLYMKYSSEYLVELIDVLSNQDKLSTLMQKSEHDMNSKDEFEYIATERLVNMSEYHAPPRRIVKSLKDIELIDHDNAINEILHKRLKEFSNYVAIRNS